MTKIVIYNVDMDPICIVDIDHQSYLKIKSRRYIKIRAAELAPIHFHTGSSAAFIQTTINEYSFTVRGLHVTNEREDMYLVADDAQFAVDHAPPQLANLRSSVNIARQEKHNETMRSLVTCLEFA